MTIRLLTNDYRLSTMAVIGLGYVGLPLAQASSEIGFDT